MGRFVDNIIAFRVLRLLTTPFEDTDAFKQGIIDKKGKELKRMRDLHTDAELEAYTLLHRLVFRIKKIIEKVPIDNKKIVSYAAAISLIKEQIQLKREPANLEELYILKTRTELSEEINWVNNNLNTKPIFTFKQFNEDGAMAAAPANNVSATPGIAVPAGKPIFAKKVVRRKQNAKVA